MTVKVLMSKLWPQAGGRTRAVMLRNDLIKNNVNSDIKMYLLERSDDHVEKIFEAQNRFGTSFDIIDIYQEIRYKKINSGNFFQYLI